jgi:lipase
LDQVVHAWGEPDAPLAVCLHGVQAHGRRFRRFAEERLAPRFRVLAPDLRGHGRSGWEPPWNLATHVRDALSLVAGEPHEPAIWIGHSFGGRLAVELLFQAPERTAAAILLDPALRVPPKRALELADEERRDRSYASIEEALAWRRSTAERAPDEALEEELREHLVESPDGRLRFRYSQSAVVAMYGELAAPPPTAATPFVPTGRPPPDVLVVRGEASDITRDEDLASLARWFGNGLEVVTVPGGHIVLWDAFEETAAAIETFVSRASDRRDPPR